MKQAVLLLTSPKVQSGFLGVNQLVTGLFLPSYPFKIPRSVLGLLWALLRLASVSVGWTRRTRPLAPSWKTQQSCTMLLALTKYVPGHRNGSKQIHFHSWKSSSKPHGFLVPLSYLWGQQTPLIEHSPWILLGITRWVNCSRMLSYLASIHRTKYDIISYKKTALATIPFPVMFAIPTSSAG